MAQARRKNKATARPTKKKKAKTGQGSKKKATRRAKDGKSLSPLLRSALEVLDHGLWHFLRSDTNPDMKFAVLHVDQAIELLLKERVRHGGKSIYKNPKETIGMFKAYEILEDELSVSIPERPDLELLHEERNTIQHKYSSPSPEDAGFHVENATRFIKRFLKDELDVELADHVSEEYLDYVIPPPTKN